MTELIVFILGLVLGSFLSVVFTRLEVAPQKKSRRKRPKRDSIVFGRSRCDHCGTQLPWYDNVPLISYLLLRARCRHCGKEISHYHPLLELTSGLYVLAAYIAYGISGQFLIAGVFGLIMLLIFAYDSKHQLIPNKVVLPAIAAAMMLVLLELILSASGHTGGGLGLWSARPLSYVIGGAVAGGFFYLMFVVSGGRWIGGGDVKLGLLMGLLLGWPYVLVALILAYLVGTAYAVILLVARHASLKSYVSFGPMLVIGFFIAEFFGGNLIQWYESLII